MKQFRLLLRFHKTDLRSTDGRYNLHHFANLDRGQHKFLAHYQTMTEFQSCEKGFTACRKSANDHQGRKNFGNMLQDHFFPI